MSCQILCPPAAIRFVCDVPEDTASRDHIIIFLVFPGLFVSNFFNWRTDANFTSRRRRLPWTWGKPLKLSYCAFWYYVVLLSEHKLSVWRNNCPWLLEHMWMRNTASWVAAHNLSCSHRSVMELDATTRMDYPKKHGL